MVVIRLAPHGRKGDLVYKITVCGKGAKLTGKYIEKLGIYKVGKEKNIFTLNAERLNYWISKGAQTSPSLNKVLRDNKVEIFKAPAKAAKTAKIAKKVAAPAPKAAAKEAPAKKAAPAKKK
jgi:small subunit ribosomal protein S16